MPVHGEYRHLVKHAQLAQSLGMPRENIVIGENGAVIELTRNSIGISGRVPAGKILVDALAWVMSAISCCVTAASFRRTVL